jgi:hypothetical protein
VKEFGIYWILIYFEKEKNGGPSPRSVDRARVAGDLTLAGGRSSPELGLAAALGHDDLPQMHGRQEGGAGTLVASSPRAEGRRGGPTTVGSVARRQCSVCEALGERR